MQSAAERLRLADQRTESAENSLRGVIADADRKLSDASRALSEVALRVTTADDKAEAREAKQALALVEDAIRGRLLCASPEAVSRLYEVA